MCELRTFQWQPGNCTNYHIIVIERPPGAGNILLCWMLEGGSGGKCMSFTKGSFLDCSYMAEKMRLDNRADLAGILALVHELRLAEVGMPSGYGLDGLDDAHRKAKDLGPITDEEMEERRWAAEDTWAKHASDAADSFLDSLKKDDG